MDRRESVRRHAHPAQRALDSEHPRMAVDSERLPAFAWLGLDALKRLRTALPPQRQQGPRNALIGLAEAASLRHDPRHREGDTLRELSALTGVSERRLRDHLRELEAIGLVRIEEQFDHARRSLPTRYVLIDPRPLGSDKSSDRGDGLAGDPSRNSSAPTRAREGGQKEERESPPLTAPRPPAGHRARDRDRVLDELAAWGETNFPGVHVKYIETALSFLPRDQPATRENLVASKLGWTLDAAESARRHGDSPR